MGSIENVAADLGAAARGEAKMMLKHKKHLLRAGTVIQGFTAPHLFGPMVARDSTGQNIAAPTRPEFADLARRMTTVDVRGKTMKPTQKAADAEPQPVVQ